MSILLSSEDYQAFHSWIHSVSDLDFADFRAILDTKFPTSQAKQTLAQLILSEPIQTFKEKHNSSDTVTEESVSVDEESEMSLEESEHDEPDKESVYSDDSYTEYGGSQRKRKRPKTTKSTAVYNDVKAFLLKNAPTRLYLD
jgi:hypothetical protein